MTDYLLIPEVWGSAVYKHYCRWLHNLFPDVDTSYHGEIKKTKDLVYRCTCPESLLDTNCGKHNQIQVIDREVWFQFPIKDAHPLLGLEKQLKPFFERLEKVLLEDYSLVDESSEFWVGGNITRLEISEKDKEPYLRGVFSYGVGY